MRVAVISRPTQEINLTSSSGISVFTYYLVNELAKRSNIKEICVFGVGKDYFQNPKVKFIGLLSSSVDDFIRSNILLQKLRNYPFEDIKNRLVSYMNFFVNKYLLENKFDIIHDNSASSVYGLFADSHHIPVLTTIHTSIKSDVILIPSSIDLFSKSSNHYFVTVSNYQRQISDKENLHLNIVQFITELIFLI